MNIPWPSMRQNTNNTGRGDALPLIQRDPPTASSTSTGGLIFSTPVIDEQEIIYVGSSDHIVRAYNPFTKKVEWEFETNEVIDSAGAIHPNGTIIIPSGDGNIYCLNKNGKKLWSFDVTKNRTPDQFSFATSYWWEGNIAIDQDGNIYAGNDDFFLYCITPEGKLKWKFRTGLFIWASVVFSEPDMVYASSFDGVIYAITRSTGKLVWSTDAKNPIISSPAIHNDTLFQCTLGGTLLALHIATGKIIWSQKIPSHVYASPLITEDDHIITASSNGNIT
ncbi:MAG: PQQ-binding-like beta-propeller repeat protein, partial [Candidatus Andersenbacteria bacterium]